MNKAVRLLYRADKGLHMRGVELPVNTMVVFVLAVIVLLGILALFLGVWSPLPGAITPQAALNTACLRLVTTRCDTDLTKIIVQNFDADKDGKTGGSGDNLKNLCLNYFNRDSTSCWDGCGCK